jgi:hypothetical protein
MNPKEVQAWLLGHSRFRHFNMFNYHDKTFEETAMLIETDYPPVEPDYFDRENAHNNYLKIYKPNQPWKHLSKENNEQ